MEDEKTKKENSSPFKAFINPSVLEHLESMITNEPAEEVQPKKRTIEKTTLKIEMLQVDTNETE